MDVEIQIKRGKSGRWRWSAYSGGKHLAGSTVRGYETSEEAQRAWDALFNASCVTFVETEVE